MLDSPGTMIMNRSKHYISVLRNQERPIKFLLAMVLRRVRLCQLFTIKRPLYRLRFFPTVLSTSYWVNPNTRKKDEDFLVSYLQSGEGALRDSYG